MRCLVSLEQPQHLLAALLVVMSLLLDAPRMQLKRGSSCSSGCCGCPSSVAACCAVCCQACYSAICTLSMPSWVLHGSITDAKGFLRMFILGSGILIGYWCRYGAAASRQAVLANVKALLRCNHCVSM
jgi:hypothetical protein